MEISSTTTTTDSLQILRHSINLLNSSSSVLLIMTITGAFSNTFAKPIREQHEKKYKKIQTSVKSRENPLNVEIKKKGSSLNKSSKQFWSYFSIFSKASDFSFYLLTVVPAVLTLIVSLVYFFCYFFYDYQISNIACGRYLMWICVMFIAGLIIPSLGYYCFEKLIWEHYSEILETVVDVQKVWSRESQQK